MAVSARQVRRISEGAKAFVDDVTQDLRHVAQRGNALRYVRGMLVGEGRKSLEPVARRGGWSTGEYHSVQNFLADAPWDWHSVMRRCAERVVPRIGMRALVLDDTSFPKSGDASPGVKRQYCGQLGKKANCQVGVSLHAAGERFTMPLGWGLYLPADWLEDVDRCRRAKIPTDTTFKTKHELALELIDASRKWDIDLAPVLGDQAYGDSTELRSAIADRAMTYCMNVTRTLGLYTTDTAFKVPPPPAGGGRPSKRPRPDRAAVSAQHIGETATDTQQIVYRTTRDLSELTGIFSFHRVRAAKALRESGRLPDEEWLIVQHPHGSHDRYEYWLCNLHEDTDPRELAELARMRWTIELDYKQLKGHLGLNHFEGRSWAGWHKHCTLVTVAHAWLTEQRLDPKAQRPD